MDSAASRRIVGKPYLIGLQKGCPSSNHNRYSGKVRFVSTGPSTGGPSITEERTRLAALQPRNVTVHSPVERYLSGASLDSLWSV